MRDPHLGAFGGITLGLQLLLKLVLLMLIAREGLWLALLLIPAWARLGPLLWTRDVPPLDAGLGERFAWSVSTRTILALGALLMLASLATPALLLAPLVLSAWTWFLLRRIGGMSGDMLGAGIELSEAALLLLASILGSGFALT